MDEYCIVNDEGIFEENIWSVEEAESVIAQRYSDEDCKIELRELYDEDALWIEDSDEDED